MQGWGRGIALAPRYGFEPLTDLALLFLCIQTYFRKALVQLIFSIAIASIRHTGELPTLCQNGVELGEINNSHCGIRPSTTCSF